MSIWNRVEYPNSKKVQNITVNTFIVVCMVGIISIAFNHVARVMVGEGIALLLTSTEK